MAKKTSEKKQDSSNSLVGTKAKNFSLEMTGGENFDLTDYKGKKIVLYFYPKDATPGCTQEGHDFSNLNDKFKKLNTVVLGVSRDTVASHEKFKLKQKYKIDLLSDNEATLCNTFDVIKDKNMYGKKVRGIERSTFVIDEDQKIIAEWRKVKVDGHAEEVLNFIKTYEK